VTARVVGEGQQAAEIHRMIDVCVQYQDGRYGPFTMDVGGVRLALACLEDEITEAKDAWRSERKPKPGTKAWAHTTSEVMDVLVVAFRLLRDMGVGARLERELAQAPTRLEAVEALCEAAEQSSRAEADPPDQHALPVSLLTTREVRAALSGGVV
jgi:NTP pyrophosphatase (non-canonical NTP hydrolase)